MENMFLSIDGIEIEDLEEGDYTAYEEELGVSERMISGRRVEEIRATIWVVEQCLGSILHLRHHVGISCFFSHPQEAQSWYKVGST